MHEDTHNLLEEALKLAPAERAEFIDALLASMDEPEPEIDALWLDEVHRRLAALDAGETETLSSEEVFAEFGNDDRPLVGRSQG